MSILNAYNPAEAIINASHFYQPIAGFPKIAVGAFKAIEPLLAAYEHEQIAELNPAGWHCPVWRVRYKGCEIAVFHSMVGGPITVGIMEEIRAMGAGQFLFYGSCGVLNRDIAASGIAIPTAAYRDEGTSYHYAPPDDSYINIPTAARLRDILTGLGLPCVMTRTWTTDAFFRETRAAMEARRAEGCGVVEMECASIMAAAQFYGIPAYQMLFAEDCLDGTEWERRSMGSVPESELERCFALSLEVAHRLLEES